MSLSELLTTAKQAVVERIPESIRPFLPFTPAAVALGGLLTGLVWNSVMLHRIDDPRTRWRLFVVLCLLGVLLTLERRVVDKRLGWVWMESRPGLVGFATLVCLSSLFNAFIVFYFRSASSLKMYVFGGLLLFVIAFARVLKQHAGGEVVRMVTFLLCSMSLFLFSIPLVTGSMGGGVFVIAAVLSLALNTVVWVVSRVQIRPWLTWLRERGERPSMLHNTGIGNVIAHGTAWGGALIALAVMSWVGAIPPLPLVIIQSGVFHDVERTADGYVGLYEPGPWYAPLRNDDHPFSLDEGDRVEFFTALFAPRGMALQVVHRWDLWDSDDGWVTQDTLSFQVTGGRDRGFRGSTRKRSVKPGHWRVVVLTESGREIGRRRFQIVEGHGGEATERRLFE